MLTDVDRRGLTPLFHTNMTPYGEGTAAVPEAVPVLILGSVPDVVLADRGHDHDKYRALVRELQIRPLIARRGTEHGSGLGKQRWDVEQTFALLHAFRRLRIRWEVRADIHEAFRSLACALICWRRLTHCVRRSLEVLTK